MAGCENMWSSAGHDKLQERSQLMPCAMEATVSCKSS